MQNLLDYIEKTYGQGLWTSAQLLREVPRELLPASTQWSMDGRRGKQAGGTSVMAVLRKTGRLEKAGRTRTGATLWRLTQV